MKTLIDSGRINSRKIRNARMEKNIKQFEMANIL
jgi:hypothetical protein